MRFIILVKVVSIVLLSLMSTAVTAKNIMGAGASFPTPIYTKWADSYFKETANRVNYQSIRSNTGVKQLLTKMVDFGASEVPLSRGKLAKKGLFQFPVIIGGIVPIVNIKGVVGSELKLTGRVLADIYLGKITHWNDPAIQVLNPTLELPTNKIIVINRKDDSGSTFVFTSYLAKVSTSWKDLVGIGTSVKWPVGIRSKGSAGVAASVKHLPNAIGYVEYAYAKQNKLSYALLQNASGKYVNPSERAFQAAAENIKLEKNLSLDMTNIIGDDVWPITTATYIVIYQKSPRPAKTLAVLDFFSWVYSQGDQIAMELGYAPLPDDIKDSVRASWSKVIDSHDPHFDYKLFNFYLRGLF